MPKFKYLLLFFIISVNVFSQTITTDTLIKPKPQSAFKIFWKKKKAKFDSMNVVRQSRFYKNEIVFNALDYFVFKRYHFSYERLNKNNQGLILNARIGDTFEYEIPKNYSAVSLGVGYNFYYSKFKNKKLYIRPNLEGRLNYAVDELSSNYNSTNNLIKNNYLAAGFTFGYKYIIYNKIVLKAELDIIRNLFNNNNRVNSTELLKSAQVDLRAVLGIGYRF